MSFDILLVSYILSLIAQLATGLFILKNKQITKIFASFSVLLLGFTISLALTNYFNIYSVLFSIFAIFLTLNSARAAVYRLNKKELYAKYHRSFLWLLALSATVLYLIESNPNIDILLLLSIFSFLGSLILFLSTVLALYKCRPSKQPINLEKSDLPTVSVCIPARNETQDLPECIESVLATTYPKLEVLVLDDCSHDKTPEIIKGYAQKGVRFLSGTDPDEHWLAKNQAMNKLFDESKGDIIIFCGVDVRFSRDSITKVVSTMNTSLDMIGVLPRRSFASELSIFIQPLRYWWELSIPRFGSSRPPVLSTFWAIRRETLKSLGEFDSFRKSVQPEAHFAKRLKDRYKFLISGNNLGITSGKKARDQYDTAIRTRYPQAKRRLELVAILLVIELLVFFTPIIGITVGLSSNNTELLVISGLSMSLLILINLIISFLTVYRTWLLGLFTLPFLVFEEWFVLIRSTLAYEFGIVMWKDRNICLPMFKVEKELPKI